MNDKPDKEPPGKAKNLPDKQEMKSEATYDAPSILLRAEAVSGFAILTVREGRPLQVQMTTRIEWSYEPVEEEPFIIRARNVVNFGGQRLVVINDEVKLGDLQLPESAPSARDYRSRVDKPVLIHFSCTRDIMESRRLDRPVYKVVRNTIILP